MIKRLLCVAGSWTLLIGTGHAQDYPLIAPKPVQPVAPAPPLPEGAAPKPLADGELLLGKLDGLVFVSSPDAVVQAPLSTSGIHLIGLSVPDQPGFETLASRYLGQPFTREQLDALITQIILFYRRHDRPVIDVLVPKQDIVGGTVQILLIEGHVAKVAVTGNHWVSSEQIRDGVRLQPGDSIRSSQLQADLDWLNQNPFHTTSAIYHPGERMGATDLELQTQDRFPARFYGGYEDSGNAATGFGRYEMGVNWGDAFHLGLDQQLNYQYTVSTDAKSLRAQAGSYVIPLPWRNTLTVFGSYTDTKGLVQPYTGIDGRSYQTSVRYEVPLRGWQRSSPRLSLTEGFAVGFDHKYNMNALEFGGLPAGGTLYGVNQFVVSYNGVLSDRYGRTTFNDVLYYSPGHWGGNNDDSAFNAAHTLATARYLYSTLSLERLAQLPRQWSLLLRGTVQKSDANLAPSEQLGFGGYDTIRGYDEREVNADGGYILNTELRAPALSIGGRLGKPWVNDQLQLLAFWDYGSASNHTLLSGEPKDHDLASVGAGLRESISSHLSVRFDYGYQLHATGLDDDHGSRTDLGIVLSY